MSTLAQKTFSVSVSRSRTPALMIQGTCSNAGKSILTAALCRILLQDGLSVAPFKSQNMALNSFVTPDGFEIGRAQAVQAAACRLEPDVRMNPVLLKPSSDTGSQVIVMGRPVGNMRVREYMAYKPQAFARACAAYDSLADEHDVMVLEGAGSPAEINLKQHDIVNMAMARHAQARVLIAGDIDRGGVFAALVGTWELLDPWERDLVAGFVLNMFRGDASLLESALTYVTERTGCPFYGVVPYVSGLGLPEEDSVSFKEALRGSCGGMPESVWPHGMLEAVLVDLPHISNFTDVDALRAEPDVRLRVAGTAEALDACGMPHLLIVPGSKNTLADLAALENSGMGARIRALAGAGCPVVGICGGFQMLGTSVTDPHGVESGARSREGLGLLPVETVMGRHKTLARTAGLHCDTGCRVSGYEIHHGSTTANGPVRTVLRDESGVPLGLGDTDGAVWGTYLHGIFDEDDFRRAFLDALRRRAGLEPVGRVVAPYSIDGALDRLAAVVRSSMDMTALYRVLGL